MPYRKIIIVWLIAWSICGFNALMAQPLKQTPGLKKGVLSNGLQYYIYPNAYPKGEAVYRLFVKAGSVYEEPDQRGLAHFLEHMAFNGTRHFPGSSMVEFLQAKGARFGKDLNAHTSYNETVYKLTLPTTGNGMVDSTLTILADWVDGMLLDSLEIEKERGVVLSEWLSRTGPIQDINNSLLEILLNGSRFSRRKTIGDTSIIKRFTRSTLEQFYRKWYRPDLMAVAVVGDVDPSAIEKMIRNKFSGIPEQSPITIPRYTIGDFSATKSTIVYHPSVKKTSLNYVLLTDKPGPIKTEKDYQDYLVRTMLNRLVKSRFSALSFSEQSYENAGASLSNFINNKAMLFGSVDLNKGKAVEGVKSFTRDFEQILRYGFTAAEINKAIKIYAKQLERGALINSPRSSETFMNEIYSDFYTASTFVSPQTEFQLFKRYKSTIDSVALARKLIEVNSGNWHYLLTSNLQNELDQEKVLNKLIAESKSQPVERYYRQLSAISELMPSAPVGGTVISKKYIPEIGASDWMLSNGARVIFKPLVSGKNRVNISAFKPGGLYALKQSDYLNGLFAANIITLSGVDRYSREEISNYMAGNTASVRFLIEKTRSGIIGSSSNDDIETLFQLLYLRSTAPRVDSSVFNQTRVLSIQNADNNNNKTKESLFADSLSSMLASRDYTNSELTGERIKTGLQLSGLLPVYNSFFNNASGFTYVIMSDTTLESLQPYIEKYLAAIPGKPEVSSPYLYKGPQIKVDSISYIATGGNSPRASVSLIFQSTSVPGNFSKYNLHSIALENLIRIRLTKIIREQLGLVYSISVNTSATVKPAALSRSSITFACLPENVDTIIAKIGDVLRELKQQPQDFENDLEDVKKNLLKEQEANIQRDLYWSTQIRNTIFNGEDFSAVINYNEQVKSISVADIAGLISQNFDFNKMIKAVLLPGNK
jgi:zinc protease